MATPTQKLLDTRKSVKGHSYQNHSERHLAASLISVIEAIIDPEILAEVQLDEQLEEQGVTEQERALQRARRESARIANTNEAAKKPNSEVK